MSNYRIGVGDPVVKFDEGVGGWNTVNPDWQDIDQISEVLNEDLLTPFKYRWAPDAYEHLVHYLAGTGTEISLNMGSFLSSTYCRRLYKNEKDEAKRFCESLSANVNQRKTFPITSSVAKLGDMGDAHIKALPENLNLFYALGGFRYWGKGNVTIEPDGKNNFIYSLEFIFCVLDRYNWNPGQAARIFMSQYPDQKIGMLNLYGIAKDFDVRGEYKEFDKWPKPLPDKRFYPLPFKEYF